MGPLGGYIKIGVVTVIFVNAGGIQSISLFQNLVVRLLYEDIWNFVFRKSISIKFSYSADRE
jgi:hypothetical protein